MEPTRCSETSKNKHNTLGNGKKTRINHSNYGESFKSQVYFSFCYFQSHGKWVRHHGMARPQVADGGTASSYGG
jgi:hypothetical protein